MDSSAPAAVDPSWLRRAVRWCVRWRLALGLLAVLAVFLLSSFPNSRPPRIRGLDKAEHIVEYFAVALLFLNVATRGYTRMRPQGLVWAWVAVVALSLLDETFQRWVPGRSFDLWDITAAACGGLVAVGGVMLAHVILAQPTHRDNAP